jgi:hypothetical protein
LSQSLISGSRLPAWQRTYRKLRRNPWLVDVSVSKARECPPGWIIAPPDFVGVGAQRAGTTWWFSLLLQHPLIDGPNGLPKELHFFDPYWKQSFDSNAIARYREYFARPRGHLAGEWTPRYMHDAWVPPLLARAAPDAKVLVMVRDPIDRYVSGLAFDLSRGAPAHPVIATDAFARGLYYRQLSHLLTYFKKEQILLLQYEKCVADTDGELSKTLRFLGVHGLESGKGSAVERVNASHRTKPRLSETELTVLAAAYADDVLALARAFSEIDLDLWPHFNS